jgi:hypothetical protein
MMEAKELEQALRQLDNLAREEYHSSLAEVVARTGDSDETRLLRLGRLLGVTLKRPFAKSRDLATPSPYSGAYRAWDLEPEAAFEVPQARAQWQYQALEALRSNPDVVQNLGWQPSSVYDLAVTAQSERGFFWYLAMSCRRYLCRKSKLRDQIERDVQTARRAGLDIKNVTPEVIVTSGGLTIGAALVQGVPALGIMGAPVIAGIIFILYSIGMDAFCRWARDHESYHAEFPNADADV